MAELGLEPRAREGGRHPIDGRGAQSRQAPTVSPTESRPRRGRRRRAEANLESSLGDARGEAGRSLVEAIRRIDHSAVTTRSRWKRDHRHEANPDGATDAGHLHSL